MMSTIKAMSLNVERINASESFKRRELEENAIENGVDIALFQETQHPHSGEEGGNEKLDWEDKKVGGEIKWYFSSGVDPQDVDKWEENLRKGKNQK